MMETPLVSVCIPAYNHERYVREAVQSVLAQDYPRIELLVVDDGSKDATWARLQEMLPECQARLERVEMVHQENAGACVTANRLVDMVRGEFYMLLASDDALLPGAVKALLNPFADEHVVLSVGQNLFFDGESRRCYWDAQLKLVYSPEKAAYKSFNEATASWCKVDPFGPKFGDYLTLVRGNHVPNGCLIRRSATRGTTPYVPEAPLGDYWSMLQLAKAGKFVTVREETFQYRWHGGNTMRAHEHMVDMTERTLAHEESQLVSQGRNDLLPGFRAARAKFRKSLESEKEMTGDSVDLTELAKTVVLRVDGGICSQIADVAYSMFLKEKLGDSVHVKLDLSWFDDYGCDLQGRQVRNWDFQKAFPNIRVDIASREEVKLLSKGFEYRGLLSVGKLKPPACLSDYPVELGPNLFRWRDVLREHFHPELGKNELSIAAEINASVSCGVHCRRGDLANGGPGYGSPTTVEYYIDAIDIIRGLCPNVKFYFFSDDLEWVKACVVPRFPKGLNYVMVDINGSDRGYADLYLLTCCDYLISSIGSFGQFAAFLSKKARWLILPRRREEFLDGLEHCIYINDDREFQRQRHFNEHVKRVAEVKDAKPQHIAYVFHKMGYLLRYACGRISTERYRWNVLRLRRRYSI